MAWNDFFVLLFFGAPAGILSSLLAVLGVVKKWPLALLVAGVWSVPATLYLGAALGLPVYLTALFVFGAAAAVYRSQMRLAWFLLLPLFFFAAWMTVLTLYNFVRA